MIVALSNYLVTDDGKHRSVLCREDRWVWNFVEGVGDLAGRVQQLDHRGNGVVIRSRRKVKTTIILLLIR